MNNQLKYVPIFRGRQQEIAVLKSFDFGKNIFPCLEIVKELDRIPPKPKLEGKKSAREPKIKTFEKVYLPLIDSIKAEKVFVDLPLHLTIHKNMKPETLLFLRTIVALRDKRTEYIRKLASLASKVIPVISTYSQVTGERGSIVKQEQDIRSVFGVIAFRTFAETFRQDIVQISKVVTSHDYLIMDWGDMELDLDDYDQVDIIEELKKLDCIIIIHRNAFPSTITMVGLEHGKIVESIDNSLLEKFTKFAGHCFSDYCGIKKDNISSGGVISPGFIYYDAVENSFFGFRFKNGSHKKGEAKPKLEEFEITIVPAVIASPATARMRSDPLDYLGPFNNGWKIIKNIELGALLGESGKSPAKFKRVSVEHYLHCMKVKLS